MILSSMGQDIILGNRIKLEIDDILIFVVNFDNIGIEMVHGY